jgi:hypothetical protein
MLWFGSSAGVALSNMYPEAKNAVQWLKHGWHVALAYIVAYLAMVVIVGWHPEPLNKGAKANGAVPMQMNGAQPGQNFNYGPPGAPPGTPPYYGGPGPAPYYGGPGVPPGPAPYYGGPGDPQGMRRP